jgi:hypothetical protein
MSLPVQSDLLGLGWGFDGEPAAWVAPSPLFAEYSMRWGFDGEPMNALQSASTGGVPIISGSASIQILM